jgi:hypothetical protein
MLGMKRLDELFGGHACLLEYAYQRADFDFSMIWNNATC